MFTSSSAWDFQRKPQTILEHVFFIETRIIYYQRFELTQKKNSFRIYFINKNFCSTIYTENFIS